MKKPAPAFKAFKVGMCVVTNPSLITQSKFVFTNTGSVLTK